MVFTENCISPKRTNIRERHWICFSGSDGKIDLAKMLAEVFQAHGLTTLALAYVMEEGLPSQFTSVPIDFLEAAAKRLQDNSFSYPYKHLSYNHGGHMFVPMDYKKATAFKGDRGKNKEAGLKDRLDSLEKTLEFVSQW